MARSLRVAVICAVCVAALLVLSAPAVALTSTVTAPAAGSSFTGGDHAVVAWRVDAAVSSGQFCICLVRDGTSTGLAIVGARKGALTYAQDVALDVGPGDYFVRILYRVRSNGSWSISGQRARTIHIDAPPMPFETLTNAPWGDAVKAGTQHDFRFWVFHPDPEAVVTAGELVFVNARTFAPVKTVPITDIGRYVIETDWTYDGTPAPNVTRWAVGLPVGTYRWHVVVTVGGVRNAMWDDATLSVTRR